jgi:hypothetical protein
MNVKEIIIKYLKDNNYDGLCDPSVSCGCGIDDLAPCWNDSCWNDSFMECQPAFDIKNPDCKRCENTCDD